MQELIDELENKGILTHQEYIDLIRNRTVQDEEYAASRAREISLRIYGNRIYVRGLIEFSNYCRNDCYYCGIRCSNRNAERYRLTEEEIFACCNTGYELGYRTFVLQSGEDAFYSTEKMCSIISRIKKDHPDCAVTLSIGEKSEAEYRAFFEAGADRYLLRHETADEEHYRKLHPEKLSLKNRKECLYKLKETGYQTGCGFMVGSPYQTEDELADDFEFIHDLKPQMVGIGPFIPHKDTPFASEKAGTLKDTLFFLSLLRIQEKNILLPATTALATIDPKGREKGILCGANVVMPNLSPKDVREKYKLYDGKVCTGEEAAECRFCLHHRVQSIGYEIEISRGDFKAE